MSLVQLIAAALPQTQCTRCGEPDCASYAQAIVAGAAINRCPPGGEQGIRILAELTGRPSLPLDPAHGLEGPRHMAWIDEASCIGCTLCIAACPVDAIVGAPKRMHTVLEPWCTGCELCVPVCPVDCIHLDAVTAERTGWAAWSPQQANEALDRYQRHQARLAQNSAREHTRLAARAAVPAVSLPEAQSAGAAPESEPTPTSPSPSPSPLLSPAPAELQATILAALARSRARRGI